MRAGCRSDPTRGLVDHDSGGRKASMARTARAQVNPELIRWVRQDAGYSVEEAAKKLRVSPERLETWERGEARPTVRQLRLLGNACRRPLAVFYLPEPPKRFRAMHDYRRLPGDVLAQASPELRFEIRRAFLRREAALELWRDLEGEPPEFGLRADTSEVPEVVAERVREALGVALETQRRWSTSYEALNGWRDAAERLGLLVFQASGVDVEEMRAFSISDFPLPVIVVNIGDAPAGRVFSMMHELAHLALRKGGLCDLVEHGERPPEDQRIEVFCNAVAADALVPKTALLRHAVVEAHGKVPQWTDGELRDLARAFSVSREVILRRLLSMGRTTPSFYEVARHRFLQEYRERRNQREGFAPPDVQAVAAAGHTFVRLVLDNYYSEQITSRDVSELLDVRLKHLAKIEEKVFGRPVSFETTR